MHYARIASRLYDTPLLITPEAGNAVSQVIRARMSDIVLPSALDSGADQVVGFLKARDKKPYSVQDGVAVIDVSGELVNRGAWIGASSGLTSYEGIVAQLKAAATDLAVGGVLMIMDSPGGEAANVSSVVAAMKTTGKPVWVFANTLMASGGYWIASAADRIGAVEDARIGSIGVVWMHADHSEELAKQGIGVTIVQAGAKKTQFSSLKALSPEALARAESIVGDIYGKFVSQVAGARGMTEDAVKATEADVFTAKEAKRIGLIDTISTADEFHTAMVKAIRSNSATGSRGRTTNASASPTTKGTPMEDMISKAAHDAAVAQARTEGIAAGVTQERDRVKAILESPAAASRPKLAQTLAFTGDVKADAAATILAAAAEEKPTTAAITNAPADLLAAAMKGVANPAVGASVDDPNANKPATDDPKPDAKAVAKEQLEALKAVAV